MTQNVENQNHNWILNIIKSKYFEFHAVPAWDFLSICLWLETPKAADQKREVMNSILRCKNVGASAFWNRHTSNANPILIRQQSCSFIPICVESNIIESITIELLYSFFKMSLKRMKTVQKKCAVKKTI